MSSKIFSKASRFFITFLWLLSLPPHFCYAWNIAPDCVKYPEVVPAMESAINMSIYAKWRAADKLPRLGTSMQDLLGAPSENDPAILDFVATWFQLVFDVVSVVVGPRSVLIHCSDAHLIPTDPDNGKFNDPTGGNTLITVPRPQGPTDAVNACGGILRAFAYFNGHNMVIVLCSDNGPQAALTSGLATSFEVWRTAGNLQSAPSVQRKGIDYLSYFISTTILHELMHVAAMSKQAESPQLSQFPNILPDPNNGQPVSEIYMYTPISGKAIGAATSSGQTTANNLHHNADSFALLAASWYLPAYGWVDGVCKTIGKIRQAPVWYEGSESAPEPSIL